MNKLLIFTRLSQISVRSFSNHTFNIHDLYLRKTNEEKRQSNL